MENGANFFVVDYVMFGLSLLVSIGIGVYFAIADRKEKSTDVYFMGKGEMSPIPVGLSLAVSFVSALTIMGFPVEVYYHGTIWFWTIICFPLVVMTTCSYFLPIFYNLRLQCVYEYLELRFNKAVRLMCSFLTIMFLILYMSTIIYYPALSLTTVTPIPVNWAIVMTVAACALYTIIGGFKSVIWTDAFQCFIMVAGCVVVMVFVLVQVGGWGNMIAAINRGNRSSKFDLTLDPFKQYSAWSIFFNQFFDWLIVMATNQAYVQRFLSCSTIQKSKMSLYVSMLPQMTITALSMATGLFLYAYFESCDPVESGVIEKGDQMLPYTVAKLTRNTPGLSGMFVATVYSGTLSTLSTGINSVTVILMEDFVSLKWTITDEAKKLRLSKITGVVIALVVLMIAFLVMFIKGSLLEIYFVIVSSFGSATLGVFTLGILVPWANSGGTLIGTGVGFVVCVWLSIGSLIHESDPQALAVSTDNCSAISINYTSALFPNQTALGEERSYSPYDISFMYFRAIAIILIVPVGIIASFILGANDPKEADPRLFMPLLDNKFLPRKFVKFMRFGVPELPRKEKGDKEELEMLTSV